MVNCFCCCDRDQSADPCGCVEAYCVDCVRCGACCRCPLPRLVYVDGGEPDDPVVVEAPAMKSVYTKPGNVR